MSGVRSFCEARRKTNPVVLTLFFTSFIAATYGFGLYLFPAVLPEMRADLGFDYKSIGLVTASAQAGFLALALLSGMLAPRIGAVPTVLGSVGVSALCLALMTLTTGLGVTGVLLTILGACAASVWVPMVAVAQQRIPSRHQGKALGLISSGTSYGVFLNGVAAPLLIAAGGWRWVWLAAGMLTALLFLSGALALWSRGAGGVKTLAKEDDASKPSWRRAARPALMVWAIMFLNGIACLPFQTYLTSFLREELLYDLPFSTRVWTIIGAVGMVGGFAMGALADRLTVKRTMAVTYALLLASAALVWGHPSPGAIILSAALFGLAFYAIFGLVPAYISLVFPPNLTTQIFGIGNITLGAGSMVGNFAGGYLKEINGSFAPVYLMIVMAAAALTVLALIVPREDRRATA